MTEHDIYIAIEAMLKQYTSCSLKHILRAFPGNRVSLPAVDEYIIMTLTGDRRLSTPFVSWTESQLTVEQDKEATVQIDFFGKNAKQWADAIIDLSRTSVLCDFLKPYQIQPLYADEATNNSTVTGEKRYIARWTVQLRIEYRTAVTVPIDTFTAAELNIFKTEL